MPNFDDFWEAKIGEYEVKLKTAHQLTDFKANYEKCFRDFFSQPDKFNGFREFQKRNFEAKHFNNDEEFKKTVQELMPTMQDDKEGKERCNIFLTECKKKEEEIVKEAKQEKD